jgi:hypothetical protein
MRRNPLPLVCMTALFLSLALFGAQAPAGAADDPDAILRDMMSNDQMTAMAAFGKLRSSEFTGQKDKLEKAKSNFLTILRNPGKDYLIRLMAADSAAYFEVKAAVPVLKQGIKTEPNPAVKMSYQNALDRLEGRISGDKYVEKPAYVGTPSYYGTPYGPPTP